MINICEYGRVIEIPWESVTLEEAVYLMVNHDGRLPYGRRQGNRGDGRMSSFKKHSYRNIKIIGCEYPMRNRHTRLVCRGLHKLKKELRRKQYRAVCNNEWWYMEKDNKNGEVQKEISR